MEPSRRICLTQWWNSAPRPTCSLPPCTWHKHGLQSGACIDAMHFHKQTVALSSFISQNDKPLLPQNGKNSTCLAVSLYLALTFEPQARAVPQICSTWLDLPLSPSSHRHSASVPQTMTDTAAHHGGFIAINWRDWSITTNSVTWSLCADN